MSPQAGSRLGPYELLAPIGAGGMGEVYKARDTRLDRTVAVKVSKERFGERFRSEALAVAALNHPHICTLFDVGPDYLVMEYVEGKALRGPLPVAEALRHAGQIADALEHAHQQGIVHRDLKPSNILVTKSGVKVLDFGLAKRLEPARQGETQPTLTEAGAVLGTPGYMAPEQIEGKPADERTDVFAFGLVLYELVTGRRAFAGKSAAAVMAAILEHEPTPISSQGQKSLAPPALEDVIRTCLAKDPAERWQSIRELKHALAWAGRSQPPRARGRAGWVAAALAAGVAIALAFALAQRRAGGDAPRAVHFQIPPPEGGRFVTWQVPAVSRDGDRIAFTAFVGAREQLFVRELDSPSVTRLDTEGGASPFWSPDGRRVGFVVPGQLKAVDPSEGAARVLSPLRGTFGGGTWSQDGVVVFADDHDLFRVPAKGGEPVRLGTRAEGETGRYWPHFLPDGQRYLYFSQSVDAMKRGTYVGSLDSEERRLLVASDGNAAYAASGHLLYVKGAALVAQRFDASRLELAGEPFRVVERVAPNLLGTVQSAAFSASANGVVAWGVVSSYQETRLTWFDRAGRGLGVLGEAARYGNPVLSLDDASVAVDRLDPETNTRDIWVFDVARGTGRRLTFDAADDYGATWSPDGASMSFNSDRSGRREIYRKASIGTGEEAHLFGSPAGPWHGEHWSPDGRFLVANHWPGRSPADLYLVPLGPGDASTPIPLLVTEGSEQRARFAPNSRLIAYDRAPVGAASGSSDVFVQSLAPDGSRGQGTWQISTGGGTQPMWRGDGRELYYLAGSTLMAVAVKTDVTSFEARTPVPLFEARLPTEGRRNVYAPTRDGQRFLVNVPTHGGEPVHVLVNWLAER